MIPLPEPADAKHLERKARLRELLQAEFGGREAQSVLQKLFVQGVLAQAPE